MELMVRRVRNIADATTFGQPGTARDAVRMRGGVSSGAAR
jgi:hypothetical protein